MDEDKKKYEFGYLISYKLTEEEASSEISNISKFIKQSGGEIVLEGATTKRRLAYPIKKESEAYFGWLEFLIAPDKIEVLKDYFRLSPNILRFLILSKGEEKAKSRKPKDEKGPEHPQLPEDDSDLEKKLNELMVAVKK